MPEGLTDAIKWIRANPTVFVPACLFVLAIGFLIGRAYVHAQDCHTKGLAAFDGVETLTQIRREEVLQKQAVNRSMAELCDAGLEVDGPVTCAKARAAIEAANARAAAKEIE